MLLLIGILIVILWAAGTFKPLSSLLGLEDFSLTAEQYPFAMHVLDVGKADAILLECDGHFMLVDGGTVDQGRPVRQYLTRRGVTQLDYVVNSPAHDATFHGLWPGVGESFPSPPVLPASALAEAHQTCR